MLKPQVGVFHRFSRPVRVEFLELKIVLDDVVGQPYFFNPARALWVNEDGTFTFNPNTLQKEILYKSENPDTATIEGCNGEPITIKYPHIFQPFADIVNPFEKDKVLLITAGPLQPENCIQFIKPTEPTPVCCDDKCSILKGNSGFIFLTDPIRYQDVYVHKTQMPREIDGKYRLTEGCFSVNIPDGYHYYSETPCPDKKWHPLYEWDVPTSISFYSDYLGHHYLFAVLRLLCQEVIQFYRAALNPDLVRWARLMNALPTEMQQDILVPNFSVGFYSKIYQTLKEFVVEKGRLPSLEKPRS